jgi:hypothetical protein
MLHPTSSGKSWSSRKLVRLYTTCLPREFRFHLRWMLKIEPCLQNSSQAVGMQLTSARSVRMSQTASTSQAEGPWFTPIGPRPEGPRFRTFQLCPKDLLQVCGRLGLR